MTGFGMKSLEQHKKDAAINSAKKAKKAFKRGNQEEGKKWVDKHNEIMSKKLSDYSKEELKELKKISRTFIDYIPGIKIQTRNKEIDIKILTPTANGIRIRDRD